MDVVLNLDAFRKSKNPAPAATQTDSHSAEKRQVRSFDYTVKITPFYESAEGFKFVAIDDDVKFEVRCHGLESARGVVALLKESARARHLSFKPSNLTGLKDSELGL
jgi:hypothetical protein